ncbi:MAG: hypothetical protein VYE68_13580 [Acidobacteriota bacterium]|nr:hypothetical protein [Acidobacteriota bacterium]
MIDIVAVGVGFGSTTGFVSGVLPFIQSVLWPALDRIHTGDLGTVFPDATYFSSKTGAPPYIGASATGPRTGERRPLGWVSYTDELEPYMRGSDGRTRMLVGLDLTGRITGIHVVEHHEP